MSIKIHLRTAYHEAGHAACMTLLGHPPREAIVAPDGKPIDDKLGWVAWGVNAQPSPRERLCVNVAGPVAQLMFDSDTAGLGWGGDLSQAQDSLSRIGIEDEIEVGRACARAKDLLSRNWSAVMAIAEELDAVGKVTADRIRHLIKISVGQPPTPKPRPLQPQPIRRSTSQPSHRNSGRASVCVSGLFGNASRLPARSLRMTGATKSVEQAQRELNSLGAVESARRDEELARSYGELVASGYFPDKREEELAAISRELKMIRTL